jgi:hypothetical protein
MQSDAPAAATLGAMARNVALGKMVGRISHAPRRRVAGASNSARALTRSMTAQMAGSASSARRSSAPGVVCGAVQRNVALAWTVLQAFHAHRHPRIGARACARQARRRSTIAHMANSAGRAKMSNVLARRTTGAGVSSAVPVLREDQISRALQLQMHGETNVAKVPQRHMIARQSFAAAWARLCSVPAVAYGALGKSVAQQQKEKITFPALRLHVDGVLGSARLHPRCGTAPHRHCLHEKHRQIAMKHSVAWCQDKRSSTNPA